MFKGNGRFTNSKIFVNNKELTPDLSHFFQTTASTTTTTPKPTTTKPPTKKPQVKLNFLLKKPKNQPENYFQST